MNCSWLSSYLVPSLEEAWAFSLNHGNYEEEHATPVAHWRLNAGVGE